MGILERAKNYKKKKEGESEVLPSEQSSTTEWAPEELSVTDIDTPSPQDPVVKETPVQDGGLTAATQQPDMNVQAVTPKWINAGSYEEAAKSDPNISRGQYAYELSKYRRSQGQPDLSYAEWSNIIKGQDPYETEAERKKRERRMNTAKILTGVGSMLGNLVNYVRAKNGHVAMDLDDGTQAYNRLERIRMGQEQLARSNAKDYLSAISHDRAERAKQEAAAASAKQAERNYQLKVDELEWKMNNAKTEAERKKAADELAAAKFAWQKQKDEATMKETERANRAREATANARVYRDDYKVATSAMDSDGNIWTRNSPLSKEEAMRLVKGSDVAKDPTFLEGFRATTTTTNEEGETIRRGDVNWFEAAAQLMADKKIPSYVLSEMGYKGTKREKGKYDQYKENDSSEEDYLQFKE